jgi:hypothetical protein
MKKLLPILHWTLTVALVVAVAWLYVAARRQAQLNKALTDAVLTMQPIVLELETERLKKAPVKEAYR